MTHPRDRHGFILTGRDLPGQDQAGADRHAPLPLETSLPGVFAAGDVRAGLGEAGGFGRRRGVGRHPPGSPAPRTPDQPDSWLDELAAQQARRLESPDGRR